MPPLEAKCPGLPPGLQGVLDRALAIDPAERFSDAEAFATALRQVAHAHRLLYSAPELAAELREIMGPNPENWLSEQRDSTHLRSVRAPQALGPGHEADSLVEPGSSVQASDDSDIEDVATPPVRLSDSRPMASRRSSGKMALVTGRLSEPTAALGSQMPSQTQATPPPPPPVPAPNQAVHPVRLPFGFPRLHLSRPSGGVAAIKRSRRRLWLFVLLVFAALFGFAFVRFFIRPVSPHSHRRDPASVRTVDQLRTSLTQAPSWKA